MVELVRLKRSLEVVVSRNQSLTVVCVEIQTADAPVVERVTTLDGRESCLIHLSGCGSQRTRVWFMRSTGEPSTEPREKDPIKARLETTEDLADWSQSLFIAETSFVVVDGPAI